MAVSQEDVKEQEIIEDDFRRAAEIFKRITKHYALIHADILYALCLIYVSNIRRRSEK